MRCLHPVWSISLAAGVLLAPLAARAEDAASAQEIVKAISADEAAHPAGRVSVTLTEHRGEFKEDEKLPETRKRLEGGIAQTWDGSVLFRPDGWFKDLAVVTAGQRSGTHVRTVETAGLLRMLVETPRPGGSIQRRAVVLRASGGTPADIILTHHVGQSLASIDWTSAKPEGDLLRLEGKRGGERHTLLVKRGAVPQIRNWTLIRRLEGPDGQSLDQRYVCDVTADERGAASRIDEVVINPPPSGNVAVRTTQITKQEPLADVLPEALRLVFPRSTVVTDTRGDAPVEYELTEDGLSDADIAATVQALSKGRARVGDAAPAFSLPDTRNKTVQLSDYQGKVLVLFWFSSRSRVSDLAAEALTNLAKSYGKSNVQFLGVAAAEDGDGAARAEAYRSRFKWSFPVALDPSAETLRRYGLETGVPKIAIVDRAGKIAYVRAGYDEEALKAALDALK